MKKKLAAFAASAVLASTIAIGGFTPEASATYMICWSSGTFGTSSWTGGCGELQGDCWDYGMNSWDLYSDDAGEYWCSEVVYIGSGGGNNNGGYSNDTSGGHNTGNTGSSYNG